MTTEARSQFIVFRGIICSANKYRGDDFDSLKCVHLIALADIPSPYVDGMKQVQQSKLYKLEHLGIVRQLNHLHLIYARAFMNINH